MVIVGAINDEQKGVVGTWNGLLGGVLNGTFTTIVTRYTITGTTRGKSFQFRCDRQPSARTIVVRSYPAHQETGVYAAAIGSDTFRNSAFLVFSAFSIELWLSIFVSVAALLVAILLYRKAFEFFGSTTRERMWIEGEQGRVMSVDTVGFDSRIFRTNALALARRRL